MFQWLQRLFRERERFTFPARKSPLPACRIRPYEDHDFDACVEIYRLNEPSRFPAGYLDHFSKWLRNRQDLVLVSEVAGAVLGLGGISMHQDRFDDIGTLNFGMVHPSFHRHGYGTALLFARLATLPTLGGPWSVIISTTGSSDSFYQRFGFTQFPSWIDDRGTEFARYRVRLYPREWKACRNALAAAAIRLDTAGAVVPRIKTQPPPIPARPTKTTPATSAVKEPRA